MVAHHLYVVRGYSYHNGELRAKLAVSVYDMRLPDVPEYGIIQHQYEKGLVWQIRKLTNDKWARILEQAFDRYDKKGSASTVGPVTVSRKRESGRPAAALYDRGPRKRSSLMRFRFKDCKNEISMSPSAPETSYW